MSLLWLDGAETWGSTTYNARAYLSGSMAVSTPGRISPGTRKFAANNDTLTTPSLGVDNTWIIGFGISMPTALTTFSWRVLNAGGEQMRLEAFDPGGGVFGLRVKRGATTVFSTTATFALNTWHYFELKVTVRTGTNGAYELRHNEINIESDTLVNLADLGSDGADGHSFGNGTSTVLGLDDIYICDGAGTVNNDFLGDSVAVGILPTAEGATINWTPSTGIDNSALVDDPPGTPDNNDYVSTNTATDKDTYAYGDLPATGLGTIHGVRVSTAASMEEVGSRTLKPKFRASGGSEGDGDDFVVDGTQVLEHPVIMEINPVTAVAWLKTDIDGGEFGMEVVT